jgi:hypothetical protein
LLAKKPIGIQLVGFKESVADVFVVEMTFLKVHTFDHRKNNWEGDYLDIL